MLTIDEGWVLKIQSNYNERIHLRLWTMLHHVNSLINLVDYVVYEWMKNDR